MEIRLANTDRVAVVDDDDAQVVSRFKWRIQTKDGCSYAMTDAPPINGRRQTEMMHRMILSPPDGMCVDHINGDGLDNRRCNIRVCTNVQNSWNTHVARGRSKYIGVFFDSTHGRWRAAIQMNGKRKYLGYFANEIDAATAYNAAVTARGEFARLNIL